MIEVEGQINAVQRRVGSRVLEAGEARTTTISQVYAAGVEAVWDACTNPERIPRWFLPVSGDLVLGGRYQLEGNAGGTISECDPPHRFAATWEYGDNVSWIEVRLAAETDGRTRFELEHLVPVDDHTWGEFGPGATGVGWDLSLAALTLHIAAPETLDPYAVARWTASTDGKRFMTMSSERWFDANVSAGADAGEARVAADRTTVAYTEEALPT